MAKKPVAKPSSPKVEKVKPFPIKEKKAKKDNSEKISQDYLGHAKFSKFKGEK